MIVVKRFDAKVKVSMNHITMKTKKLSTKKKREIVILPPIAYSEDQENTKKLIPPFLPLTSQPSFANLP